MIYNKTVKTKTNNKIKNKMVVILYTSDKCVIIQVMLQMNYIVIRINIKHFTVWAIDILII